MSVTMELPDAFWFQEGPGVRNWQFTDSGIKLLNVANITKNGEIDLKKTSRCLSEAEVKSKYTHFLADAGDLVIASSGISFEEDGLLRTRGAFVEKRHLPLCMNTSTIRFKQKAGLSDLEYLKFWLDSNEFRGQITRLVTGSAQQNFGPSHLKALNITLPPLEEQQQIASRLRDADRLRRTREYALELTESFLPAAFEELFGDLHRNEREWAFERLDSSAKIVSGVAKGQKYRDSETVEVPYLRVANVQDGYLDLSEIKTIHVPPAAVRDLRLQPGDVVMTEGGDYDKLGRGAIWPGGIEDCIHQNHIFRVRLNSSVLTPRFFAAFLRSPFAKSYFLRCSKQTTNLASINMTQLRATPIPLPSVRLQRRFDAMAEQVDRLRVVQEQALRQAEHLFDSLLNLSFRS